MKKCLIIKTGEHHLGILPPSVLTCPYALGNVHALAYILQVLIDEDWE